MDVRQAVIMVGGKGTRLRPLTDTCPKPILPVLDRPCLDYLIDSLVQGGIEHIILACGYRSEQVSRAIGDGSDKGIVIEYSYEDEPMGTAGAMKLLEDRLDDVFVAANGDVFADIDVKGEIDEHMNSGASVTISLTTVTNPCEFGIARVADDGRILEFKEKPKPEEVFSNLINSGIYVVNKDVLKYVPAGTMYDFSKDLVKDLMEKGHRIQGHAMQGIWKDVGRPSDLIEANLIMAERMNINHGSVTDSAIVTPFYSGTGSSVKRSELTASVVSKDCRIEDSTLTGSLVMEHSEVYGSTVTDSIIGRGCVIRECVLCNEVLGDGTVIDGDGQHDIP